MMRSSYWFRICCWLLLSEPSLGWKQCAKEDGGGSCPDHNTCCPTTETGISSCIPAKSHDPDSAVRECCNMGTGCGYGYICASNESDGRSYCQRKDEAPEDLADKTSSYRLCTVPTEMQTFYGYPMGDGTFQVAYYSNMGDIYVASDAHLAVETAFIMIHGSARNADDYFCAALSLLDDDKDRRESTLVITPLFSSPEDAGLMGSLLLWADHDVRYPLSHSWRYGADAMNAPISSYQVLDSIVEYLESATVSFPNLKRIAVAGHSAGGQVTHRWSLLSSSPAWEGSSRAEIVSIVANPRSYCYLDERRIQKDGSFAVPDVDDTAVCSTYNTWQWGLDEGGYVPCPYKDRALELTSAKTMAERFARRQVVYLSGELDLLRTNDRCETSVFQGNNRQERAKHYYSGLQEYFGRQVHELNIVTGSPHDHSLMFQSSQGEHAIFGDGQDKLIADD